jgi:hypothetical protein
MEKPLFHKKIIIGFIVFSVMCMGLILPSVYTASSPGVTTHYGLIGYNGNDSIYMTTGVGSNALDPLHLSNVTMIKT